MTIDQKDTGNLRSISPLEKSIPDAQSVLLEYIKRNPNNKKVLNFLHKHYDIQYNEHTKQWEENVPQTRQRVLSEDNAVQMCETPQLSMAPTEKSQTNKVNMICDFMNKNEASGMSLL